MTDSIYSIRLKTIAQTMNLKWICAIGTMLIVLLASLVGCTNNDKRWRTEEVSVRTPEEQQLFEILKNYNPSQSFQKLEEILTQLDNVNLKDSEQMTPLGIAVDTNNVQGAKILLQCKANANCRVTSNGIPVIHLAIRRSNNEMIKLLINNNAKLSPKCIQEAITIQDRELVRFLVSTLKEENIVFSQEDKQELLKACIEKTYIDGFDELRINDLLPDLSNDRNSLFLLQKKDSPQFLEFARLLFKAGCPGNVTHNDKKAGKTYDLLTFALESGTNKGFMEQFFQLAFYRHANPNYVIPETGETALYLAVKNEADPVVQLLLNKGADYNLALKDSLETPFTLALVNKNVKAVQDMLEHNANPNALLAMKQANKLLTPLGIVIITQTTSSGSDRAVEIIQLLLEKGADPTSKVDGKNTVLRLLLDNTNWDSRSRQQAISLIIKKGGIKNLPDEDFVLLLDNLISNGKEEMALSILKSIPARPIEVKMTELLCKACALFKPEAVKFLLKNGAKAAEPDYNGNTPLWYAIPTRFRFDKDKDNALACILHLKEAGVTQADSKALNKIKECPDSNIRALFVRGTRISKPSRPVLKVSKPAVIEALISAKPSDARKAIEDIDAYIQQSNDVKDKMALEQLKKTLRNYINFMEMLKISLKVTLPI